MKLDTDGGALTAALILFLSNLMTLFQQSPELTFSGITQAAWVAIVGGAAIAYLKDRNAVSVRRGIAKLTTRKEE